MRELHERGVSTIYLGYPFNIAQDKGNKFTVNLWSYRELMGIIELKAQEYGMRVFEVIEYNTSKYCAYHGVEVTRDPRGVVNCPKGHRLHSDLTFRLERCFKHSEEGYERNRLSSKEAPIFRSGS
ncbi:MAG: zinc ribbon domain-containing protein [Thermocladium sp.]